MRSRIRREIMECWICHARQACLEHTEAPGPATKRVRACTLPVLALSLLLLACPKRPQSAEPPVPLVHVVRDEAGHSAVLKRGDRTLAVWKAVARGRNLGEWVSRFLQSEPGFAEPLRVIWCGDPDVPFDWLTEAAAAMPSGAETITCMPDRRNCPNTCPEAHHGVGL